MRKHAVIHNIGEGDDIKLVGLFDTALEACKYAKECAIELKNELNNERPAGTPGLEITETLNVTNVENYTYNVLLSEGVRWYVHPMLWKQ